MIGNMLRALRDGTITPTQLNDLCRTLDEIEARDKILRAWMQPGSLDPSFGRVTAQSLEVADDAQFRDDVDIDGDLNVDGSAVVDGSVTAGSLVVNSTAWTAVTFENSWVNYGSGYNEAAYWKDASGFVHLRGLVKDGTLNGSAAMFTLPTGYRPAGRELFNAQANGALARVDITTAGAVVGMTGSNAWFSLDSITFKAA